MAYTIPYYNTNTNNTILDICKNNKVNLNLITADINITLPNKNILLLNEHNINYYKDSSTTKICLNTKDIDTIIQLCKTKWFIDIIGGKIDKIHWLDVNNIIDISL
jgi:hypothetical protein